MHAQFSQEIKREIATSSVNLLACYAFTDLLRLRNSKLRKWGNVNLKGVTVVKKISDYDERHFPFFFFPLQFNRNYHSPSPSVDLAMQEIVFSKEKKDNHYPVCTQFHR